MVKRIKQKLTERKVILLIPISLVTHPLTRVKKNEKKNNVGELG